MTSTSKLLAGVFGTFLLSWVGIVVIPFGQIGNLQPQVDEEAGTAYPLASGGTLDRGRDLYVSNGCVYCHTQLVRDPDNGSDIARGWGDRRTVARDYLFERPALGVVRYGPDLANIGVRKADASRGDAQDKYTEQWYYRHLYNPRSVTPKSIMPAYGFLFERRKVTGQVSTSAISTEDGYEILPSTDAKVLVAYMMSLDRTPALKEAPVLKEAAAK